MPLFYMTADWPSFSATIEQQLQTFNLADYNSIDLAVQRFNKTITDANKTHFPTGTIRHFIPCFNRNIKQKLKTWAQLSKQMPTPDVLDRIRVLNTEIEEDIKHDQTAKWKQLLKSTTYNTNDSKLWKLIYGLNNRYTDKTDTHEAMETEETPH